MKVKLSDHARQRAAEMGVSTKRIKQLFRNPHLDYPSTNHPNCRVAVHGDLAIPYDPRTGIVITVLWNQEVTR